MALLILGFQQGALIPLLLSLQLGDLGWPGSSQVFAVAEKREWAQTQTSQTAAYWLTQIAG